MYKVVGFAIFLVAIGKGEDVISQHKVYCAETPSVIFSCLHEPKVVNPAVSVKCDNLKSECDRMNCIFRESGWLEGSAVDKQKVSAHFEQFAKDHPEWSPAVQSLKTVCLEKTLAPQGVILNCPPYDVMHCIITSFIRNASASQWSTEEKCAYSRSYASACPVCPSSCFAPQVPIGSCNACYPVSHSPQP